MRGGRGSRPLVLVDATMTRYMPGGTTRYTLDLLDTWRRNPRPDLDIVPVHGPALREASGTVGSVANLARNQAWLHALLPARAVRARAAAVFHPSFTCSRRLPCPQIVMIHDLSFERFPEQFPRPFLRWIRWATRMSVRRADLLLALSESTRQDLIRLWGVPPDRVEVGYPGIAPAPGPDLPRDPAVLYVGDFSPRKRVPLLIDAYRRYREVADGPEPCELLLVGGGGADAERVAAAAARTPGVRLLGRVDDRALDDLYRRSTLLVYPSLYEGFGLPIVEALSRGTPVLAARNSSLPEAGGAVAHYADVDGAAGLGDRLAALLADRDALLSGADARRAHAARFSPQAAADRVADLLARTIAGSR